MTSPAITACRRCRDQKLRCSRELPVCARCVRFNVMCTYPAPPDRKVLATVRARPKKRSSVYVKSKSTVDGYRSGSRPSTPLSRSLHSSSRVAVARNSTISDDDVQLPLAVQELLQEVYFTCQFHSTLLFHRPTFTQAFRAGNISQHVLLAMYANSTIFLPSGSSILSRCADLLQPLGDLKALGRKWAVQAARTILQDVDQPTFESVQCCEMLCLYWFSAGEYKRNTMFLCIAYKAACMLGLDTEDGHTCFEGKNPAFRGVPEWLRAEMARRVFWAVWYTHCINSDHGTIGKSSKDKFMDLPLPMDELSYIRGQQAPSTTLSTLLDKSSSASNKEQRMKIGILGELLVLMQYWAKIRYLLDSRTQSPAREWLTDVYELDSQLLLWRSGLSSQLCYSKRNLYELPVINHQSLFILVHALYHQCRTVLHSSLVPQFCGLPLPETVPVAFTNVSAQTALRSAQEISSLGADLLALDWDPTRIPAFVGYCMYVSASIQIAILGSTDSPLKASAWTSLVSNLKWLNSLQIYWLHLGKLRVRVHVLYEAQMSRLRAQGDEGMDGLLMRPTQAFLKDLDQLASEVRDPGQLPEPLADSILEYSLHRFQPIGSVHSRAIQELEDATSPDQSVQIMAETPQSSQLAASAALDLDGHQAALMTELPENQRASFITPMSLPDYWMSTSQAVIPQLSAWDWLELNSDTLQQPTLGYDDLLGLNYTMY